MGLYLSILEGESPFVARPVMSSSDPALIAAVAEILAARLGVKLPGSIRDLRRVPNNPSERADD